MQAAGRLVPGPFVALRGAAGNSATFYQEVNVVISAASLSPILSIIFGILILIVPRFLNYLVAIYLILAGLLGLGIVRL
jgi:hypothetical protein